MNTSSSRESNFYFGSTGRRSMGFSAASDQEALEKCQEAFGAELASLTKEISCFVNSSMFTKRVTLFSKSP